MYFYVDESGNTGAKLFDLNQPTLYYGVLVARDDLVVSAERRVDAIRKLLGVDRLHANQLGQGRLVQVAHELRQLQADFELQFDVFRVNKSDHAVIQFFDQVFDSGMNSAVAWASYWTVRRYFILLDLAVLFDEPLRRTAWEARLDLDSARSDQTLTRLCKTLLKRMGRIKHEGTRRIIRRALQSAAERPSDISYNVRARDQTKQVSPNIIGFQFVMQNIAARTLNSGVPASKIIVDRQGEFNGAQRVLSEFYAKAADIKFDEVPGVMDVSFEGMPQSPIIFSPGDEDCGLEIADIYLWLFKLFFERKPIAAELQPLIDAQLGVGNTDELSLDGIRRRVARTFDERPQLFRATI